MSDLKLKNSELTSLYLSGYKTIKVLAETTKQLEAEVASKIVLCLTKEMSEDADVLRHIFLFRFAAIKIEGDKFIYKRLSIAPPIYNKIFKIMEIRGIDLFLKSEKIAMLLIKVNHIKMGEW